MEMKRRPFTLSGGIVNIVFGALDILATILVLFIMIEYNSQTPLDPTYLIVLTVTCIIEFIFAIVIIILSSILVSKNHLTVSKFDKYTGLIITLFVFDCIAVVGSLINAISGNYFSIVVMIIYAMCGIFIMLDLCANKKELKQSLNVENNEVVKVEKPVETEKEKQKNKSQNTTSTSASTKNTINSSASKLYQTLLELKEMKEADIITEEEYKKLKEKLIDKYEF